MEQWIRLKEAGLEPPGLGPPPRSLRGAPPEESPGQPLMSSEASLGGARESLLWVWQELGSLRRADVQLLGQLCSLALEMGALREELVTVLEAEGLERCDLEEAEQEEEPQGKQEEGQVGASCPALRAPDFEMTI